MLQPSLHQILDVRLLSVVVAPITVGVIITLWLVVLLEVVRSMVMFRHLLLIMNMTLVVVGSFHRYRLIGMQHHLVDGLD